MVIELPCVEKHVDECTLTDFHASTSLFKQLFHIFYKWLFIAVSNFFSKSQNV